MKTLQTKITQYKHCSYYNAREKYNVLRDRVGGGEVKGYHKEGRGNCPGAHFTETELTALTAQ